MTKAGAFYQPTYHKEGASVSKEKPEPTAAKEPAELTILNLKFEYAPFLLAVNKKARAVFKFCRETDPRPVLSSVKKQCLDAILDSEAIVQEKGDKLARLTDKFKGHAQDPFLCAMELPKIDKHLDDRLMALQAALSFCSPGVSCTDEAVASYMVRAADVFVEMVSYLEKILEPSNVKQNRILTRYYEVIKAVEPDIVETLERLKFAADDFQTTFKGVMSTIKECESMWPDVFQNTN